MEMPESTVQEVIMPDREGLMEGLYENAFPSFARFAARRNASLEEARDVFHDALVIFMDGLDDPDRVIQTSPEAYVAGIARHLWFRRFRSEGGHVTLAGADVHIPEDYFPRVNERRLLRFLEHAGKRCLDVLHKFYYERAGLREIAVSLGFRTEHSAAVQKYKCLGKLKEAVKAKSLHYEDFLF